MSENKLKHLDPESHSHIALKLAALLISNGVEVDAETILLISAFCDEEGVFLVEEVDSSEKRDAFADFAPAPSPRN